MNINAVQERIAGDRLAQLVAAALLRQLVLAALVELEFLEPAALAWQLSELELV